MKNKFDEERSIKNVMRYFGRHVENLTCVGQGTPNWFLKGDSPFGDGTIIIDQMHNWHCNATNKGGDGVYFLKMLNPLLTDRGAYLAAIEESVDTPDFDGSIILNEDNFRINLNSFRAVVKTMPYPGEANKAVFMNNNFWINEADEYNYMEMSRTNKPLCRYQWGYSEFAGGETFLTCGVPRIKEHTEADRIYFVENPYQLIFLKETVSDPIYVKPTKQMYSLNNYLKLVEGKDIVNCRLDYAQSFALENWSYDHIDGKNTKAVKTFFTGEKWKKGHLFSN